MDLDINYTAIFNNIQGLSFRKFLCFVWATQFLKPCSFDLKKNPRIEDHNLPEK